MSPKLWDNYNVIVPVKHYSITAVWVWFLQTPVVAPSSVISTVNRWDGIGYYLMDGTGMAVPYVSGGLALLMEKAYGKHAYFSFKAEKVYREWCTKN